MRPRRHINGLVRTALQRTARTLRSVRPRTLPFGVVAIALFVAASLPLTAASFADSASMKAISVAAGTLATPTLGTPTEASSDDGATTVNVSVPFTAGTGGSLTPDGYLLYRGTSPGGESSTPLNPGGTTSSPLVDTTANECAQTYYYKAAARSITDSFHSLLSSEKSITTVDRTAPTFTDIGGFGTNSTTPTKWALGMFKKNTGNFEFYFNTADNCASDPLTLTLAGSGAKTIPSSTSATQSGGPWTINGTTYAWKYSTAAPNSSTTETWTATVTDTSSGLSTTTSSQTIKAVTAAPTLTVATVPTWSNWYWSGQQYVAQTTAADGSGGFRIYVSDSSNGADPITFTSTNTNAISGTNSTTLAATTAGSNDMTADGATWNYVSAVLTPNGSGTTGSLAVSGTDVFGNTASSSQTVYIDGAAPTALADTTLVSDLTDWRDSTTANAQGKISFSGNAVDQGFYIYATGTDALSGSAPTHMVYSANASAVGGPSSIQMCTSEQDGGPTCSSTPPSLSLPNDPSQDPFTIVDGTTFSARTMTSQTATKTGKYTVTMEDPVGYSATITVTNAIAADNTNPTTTGCVLTQATNKAIKNGDTLAITYNSPIVPFSFMPGYISGTSSSFGFTFTNATSGNDWAADSGLLNFLMGTTGTSNAVDLGSNAVIGSTLSYTTSTITNTSNTTYTIRLNAAGAPSSTNNSATGTGSAHLNTATGSSGVMDVAGNTQTTSAVSCTHSRSKW